VALPESDVSKIIMLQTISEVQMNFSIRKEFL